MAASSGTAPPFPHAVAEGGDARALARDCLAQLGSASGGLGFLYATDALADGLGAALSELTAARPDTAWIGCVGTGLVAGGREIYDRPALALLLSDWDAARYRVVGAGGPGDAEHDWCRAHPGTFALLHGDPSDAATAPAIDAAAAIDGLAFVNGGLASSRDAHLQVAGGLVRGGLSGVLLDPGVALVTDHTQGCTPLGPAHALTEARRNVAIRLDGRPALAVLREEVGEVLARDLTRIAGYIFAALPVQHSDTGDYLVRNLVGFDPEREMVAVGDNLERQASLMFCRRDGASAVEDLGRMLARLRKRCAGRTIRGGVYVTCVGRGRQQFGDDSEEVRAIHAALGEFPLVGFFANGEIYNGRLYGYTGVLTLFLG